MPIRKCVLKLRAIDRAGCWSAGRVEVKVAGEYNQGIRIISPGVVYGLAKLGAAQPIITSAFEMQVIGRDHFPGNVGVTDQLCALRAVPETGRFREETNVAARNWTAFGIG